MLKQYLTIFETAEINSTFYALPKPGFIRHLQTVPDEKFFTAKLPKKVTHDHRLDLTGEAGDVLAQYFTLLSPIREKLATLLIQLPPWQIQKMADLETFLSELDSSFRYAIEFRDESWLTESVFKLLEDYGLAYVIVDEPKLPIDLRVTTDFSYIRWHGHGINPWFNYRYSIEELQAWKPRLQELESWSETILGYFNNHFGGKAPLNALQMLQLLEMISPQQERKLGRMLDFLSVSQTSLDEF
ncbi:MAG: DUF72 domain-containing protein [Candidatus Hodarchaeota archaeon]